MKSRGLTTFWLLSLSQDFYPSKILNISCFNPEKTGRKSFRIDLSDKLGPGFCLSDGGSFSIHVENEIPLHISGFLDINVIFRVILIPKIVTTDENLRSLSPLQ